MTLDYRIPKIETKTLILMEEDVNEPSEYVIFLNEFSRYRKGPETVLEFLNKDREFIPIKNVATGEFKIININKIVYLIDQQEFDEPQDKKHVTLTLNHNIKLETEHFKPLPDSQSRIVDYLNEKSKFIVFYFNGHKIFINKNKIIKVTGY